MRPHNFAAGVEPQAHTFLFGGGKRMIQTLLNEIRGHSRSGVSDAEEYLLIISFSGSDGEGAVLSCHRLQRVQHKVFDYLLNSFCINHREERWRKLCFYFVRLDSSAPP